MLSRLRLVCGPDLQEFSFTNIKRMFRRTEGNDEFYLNFSKPCGARVKNISKGLERKLEDKDPVVLVDARIDATDRKQRRRLC